MGQLECCHYDIGQHLVQEAEAVIDIADVSNEKKVEKAAHRCCRLQSVSNSSETQSSRQMLTSVWNKKILFTNYHILNI